MDSASLRAYVVEDNPTLRDSLISTLEELTCVRVVGTGSAQGQADGWLAGHVHGWDLLIVDLFLKGGSGMHLLQQLAVHEPWQKVIVFSNYVDTAVRKRCAQLGVDAVFDKSTEFDALVDYCVRQCFLRAQAGQPRGGDAACAPGIPPPP